ncbi:hypothetical protein [Flavobacterium succinicans]|uniref:Uncharacterized protein n=1 Tax=Flavobacterium succinicans TaxID=29536 RepID=A0A199XUN8_9FLAO|nr:hypothetical protein [Flavobacterium succinicans]OAZ05360.1 hypothetical protein FLB_02490 [Flavobacterium succinicans]
MKKLFALLLVFLASNLFAQATKLDKIIKKDYSILDVNITNITDSDVEFNYPNEKLKNTLSLSKVAKIIFKSGREQNFNIADNSGSQQNTTETKAVAQANQITPTTQSTIKQNTIAVLPIPFVNKETLASSSEMAKFAQNDMYNKLMERSANIFPLTVQDLRETNSLLKKAGIDYSNIDEVLISDLQNILGVDNIVAAKVSYVVTVDQTNTGYGNTTITAKNDSKAKVDDFNVSTTTQNKKFDFTVYFEIYKNGSKIFTETRTPVFNFKDSWMDSMQYLLKRSPIYSKK